MGYLRSRHHFAELSLLPRHRRGMGLTEFWLRTHSVCIGRFLQYVCPAWQCRLREHI